VVAQRADHEPDPDHARGQAQGQGEVPVEMAPVLGERGCELALGSACLDDFATRETPPRNPCGVSASAQNAGTRKPRSRCKGVLARTRTAAGGGTCVGAVSDGCAGSVARVVDQVFAVDAEVVAQRVVQRVLRVDRDVCRPSRSSCRRPCRRRSGRCRPAGRRGGRPPTRRSCRRSCCRRWKPQRPRRGPTPATIRPYSTRAAPRLLRRVCLRIFMDESFGGERN
jgi:hypothetical protein